MLESHIQFPEHFKSHLRENLRKIKHKFPNLDSMSPKSVARAGLLKESYHFYSKLSSDAAHPTLASLKRYVGEFDVNGEARIVVAPCLRGGELVETWNWACCAMLGACVAVNDIFGGLPAGQELRFIADRYTALRG